MRTFIFAPILSLLATPAFASLANFRSVVESPEERRAIVELTSSPVLEYRLCSDAGAVSFASEFIRCERVGVPVLDSPLTRARIDRIFTEELALLIQRAEKGDNVYVRGLRTMGAGILTGAIWGLIDHELVTHGYRTARTLTGPIYVGLGGLVLGNWIVKRINTQNQDEARRLRSFLARNQGVALGQPQLWHTPRISLGLSSLKLIAEALGRATEKVAALSAISN